MSLSLILFGNTLVIINKCTWNLNIWSPTDAEWNLQINGWDLFIYLYIIIHKDFPSLWILTTFSLLNPRYLHISTKKLSRLLLRNGLMIGNLLDETSLHLRKPCLENCTWPSTNFTLCSLLSTIYVNRNYNFTTSKQSNILQHRTYLKTRIKYKFVPLRM